MLDFDVQKCTRKCAGSDRELKAGEVFYSDLVQDGAEIVRKDFCEQEWKGPAETSLGWWKAQMPETTTGKMRWAPNEVMLQYFAELEEQQDKLDTRYILGLLLVRRRLLRLEESVSEDDGEETLVLYSQREDQEHHVQVVTPTKTRAAEIQEELAKMLFAEVT